MTFNFFFFNIFFFQTILAPIQLHTFPGNWSFFKKELTVRPKLGLVSHTEKRRVSPQRPSKAKRGTTAGLAATEFYIFLSVFSLCFLSHFYHQIELKILKGALMNKNNHKSSIILLSLYYKLLVLTEIWEMCRVKSVFSAVFSG